MVQNTQPVTTAEARLLAALIKKPEYIKDVSESLFIHPECIDIYRSIKELSEKSGDISLMSVYQLSSAKNILVTDDEIGVIKAFLDEDFKSIEPIKDVLVSAKLTFDNSKKLNSIIDAMNSQAILSKDAKESLSKQLDDVRSSLATVSELDMPVLTFSEAFDRYLPEFDKRRNGKIYKFGDELLDELITTGPEPGCGGIISAASGMGKSAYSLNLVNGFINLGIPSMLFSLEMGLYSTMDRFMSMRTGIPFKSIASPDDPAEFESIKKRIIKERESLDSNEMFRICENPDLSLGDIASEVKKFQEQIKQTYCIVVLDLVSMIRDFCGTDNRNVSSAFNIENAINSLNALSKQLGFHYIGLVQQSRDIEKDRVFDMDDLNKLRPTRSTIKNSNAYLERARYSIGLFRKKYYAEMYLPDDEETKEMQDIVEVSLLKQNNGVVGRRYMLFDGNTFTLAPFKYEEKSKQDS